MYVLVEIIINYALLSTSLLKVNRLKGHGILHIQCQLNLHQTTNSNCVDAFHERLHSLRIFI